MGALLLIALGGAVLYGYSLWRHPYIPCKRCRGGDVKDSLWTAAFGNCWHCGGRGQFPRLGVRVFMPKTARAIRGKQHGKNY